MDGDFPWIYVAMIFIAFISWVKSRLDEAAKIRQERAEAREAAKRAKRESKPVEAPSPYRPREATSRPTAPASVPVPVPTPTVPDMESRPVPTSFREFFEMVKEAATEPEPVAPPPLPKPSPPVPAPVVAEVRRSVTASAPVATAAPAPRTSRLLRSRAGLRDAMVLKEILDPPVSMR